MPENLFDKSAYTLLEVTNSIRKTLLDRYKRSFWVKAEMNKLNHYPQSGHCYPDLVEKQEGRIVAQIRSTLWKEDYLRINTSFLKVLNEPLKDGIKILFLAKITFDPVYGLALRIIDIDAGYTLGDIEREKQETIERLQTEGVFNKNRSLQLPLLPQRIAIISVESSKGYKDFLGKIDNNPWGYMFFHMLFPSLLQGEKVILSITEQLNKIRKVKSHFDMVAIIRGGGGDVGLSSYNNYQLAREIALFPLPVLTGIGHITNETVVEMVSYKNLITPTDLADFLTQVFHNFAVPVKEAGHKVKDKTERLIKDEKSKLQAEFKLLRSAAENRYNKEHQLIKHLAVAIRKDIGQQLFTGKLHITHFATRTVSGANLLLLTRHEGVRRMLYKMSGNAAFLLKNKTTELINIEKNVNNMSPGEVMRRGYSITLLGGRAIKNPEAVKQGDTIETILSEGRLTSVVKSKNKP